MRKVLADFWQTTRVLYPTHACECDFSNRLRQCFVVVRRLRAIRDDRGRPRHGSAWQVFGPRKSQHFKNIEQMT